MGALTLIGNMLKGLVNYFTYVEEMKVLDDKVIDEINKKIDEIERALNEMNKSTNETERDMIKSVRSSFKKIEEGIKDGTLDKSKAKNMISSTIQKINEIESITIEEPHNSGKGGSFGTVTYKGEESGEKKVGGVIVPKEGELAENIGGKYSSNEKIVEILNELANQIDGVNSEGLIKEAQKEINASIEHNSEKLATICNEAAKNLPDKVTGKNTKVKRNYKGFKRLCNTLVAAGFLFTLLGKKVDYQVANLTDTTREFETAEKVDEELGDLVSDIDVMKMADFNRINEVFATGNEEKYGMTGQNAEIQSRKDGVEFSDKREELTKAKEDAINQFNSKANHTNAERLAFEIEMLNLNKQVLELQNEVNGKTIEYSTDWIELNDEHIASGELYDWAVEEHEGENDNSRVSIEAEEKATIQNIEEIKSIERKIAIYEKLAQGKDVEKIVNVENAAETVFEFLESDLGKQIGVDNFLKFMEGKNIELFTSYAEFTQSEDVDQFLDGFDLLNNTFGEYVVTYCEGDISRVDTDQYAQFFEEAVNNEKDIGKQGFFNTLKAMLDQNNLNRIFYEQEGKALAGTDVKTGWLQRVGRNISTIFNGQRAGRYNEVINQIDKDRNINTNEKSVISNTEVELNEDER